MAQAILAICVLALVLGGVFLLMQPALADARHDRIMERLNLARERTTQTQMFTQSMTLIALGFFALMAAGVVSYLFAGIVMGGFAMLTAMFASMQNRQPQTQYVAAPPAAPALPEVRIYVPVGETRGNWELYSILLNRGQVQPDQKVVFVRDQLPPPDGKDLMVID